MPETVILKLKDGVTNPDGSPAKDASKETRSQQDLSKLSQSEIMKSWPPLTVGITLVGLINSRKPENTDEMSKLSRMLTKVRNKMLTDKGEWKIDQQELLDLMEIFDKADPKTLNVSLHGQIYNKIQDLLLKTAAT